MKNRILKTRILVTLSAAAVSLVIGGVAVTARSADHPSTKTAPAIQLSELQGYDAWQMIAPSQPDDAGGCGGSPAPGCIKVVVGNPVMIKAYKDGVPANGKAVPDGAKLAKLEWKKSRNPSSPYAITVPGELVEISFMVKDSGRFSSTNGWGYATFNYDASRDQLSAASKNPSVCHTCHTTGAKPRDFVFTNFAKR